MAAMRLNRRRLSGSLAAGLLAALLTAAAVDRMAAESQAASSSGRLGVEYGHDDDDADSSTETVVPEQSLVINDSAPSPVDLSDSDRLLAISRHDLVVPVAVGDRVELVGLRPTFENTEAVVVSPNAVVVSLDENRIVLALDRQEAYRAVELQAIGTLMVLGLDHSQ